MGSGGGGGAVGAVIDGAESDQLVDVAANVVVAGGNGGNGNIDVGGGGGAGGFGYLFTLNVATQTVTVEGAIRGGNGGDGGAVEGPVLLETVPIVSGSGGDGGTGMLFLFPTSAATINIAHSGTIIGGNAGAAGANVLGNAFRGDDGAAGAGIAGANLTINDAGTIEGGSLLTV